MDQNTDNTVSLCISYGIIVAYNKSASESNYLKSRVVTELVKSIGLLKAEWQESANVIG